MAIATFGCAFVLSQVAFLVFLLGSTAIAVFALWNNSSYPKRLQEFEKVSKSYASMLAKYEKEKNLTNGDTLYISNLTD
jgi:hypothetical protein